MIKTPKQIEEEFLTGLQALLASIGRGIDLECSDYYDGCPECGEDVHMNLVVPSSWDDDGNQIQEYCEINIGSWICGDQE